MKAVPPVNRPLQKTDLDRSVEILRDRVDRLGVAEPEIRKQGNDQIVIDLPGIKNPEQVIEILGKTAQLELFDLESNLVPPSISAQGFPIAKDSLYSLLAGQQALVDKNTKTAWYLFDDKKKLRGGPVASRDKLLQSKAVEEAGEKGKLPKGWKIFGVPPKTVVLQCGIGEVVCPGVNEVNPTKNYFYLFRFGTFKTSQGTIEVPEMRGDDLKLSGTRADFDTTTGEPIVTMQFTDKGADKFGEITREEAERGRLLSTFSGGQKVTQHFAIVLDREIKSWPSIDWEQYPNGISGTNGAQITGIGDLQEAKDLALVLQTGALPVTFTTLEQTAISATLGKDSLAEAWLAAIAGLLAVALFLLIFYRVLGVVAVIGLGIYAALPLRGDPALQRHADPAGLRRDDPDTGGGRRREHRHLRAREGGVPRRQVGARRDRGGLRQGLRDDHRRQRRHRDHGDRALPRRDRGSQGLRADAPDRNADVAADRGRGDARDPRPARRLQVVRQPEADGRRG